MKHILVGLLGVVIVACAGFFAIAWKSAIAPITPPDRASFDQALVHKGAMLAAVGNCTACHTQPGGHSFAGGFALPTPFGTIYSSNITPDPETGIGAWSEAAFNRAMREGVSRDGKHLYPAFPFDHFTLVSDEDNKALYAFLMTRPPVKQTPPANELPFPLNVRLVLAGWKTLFFNEGAYQDVASESAEWNRGAYLVNGLGHCGACHTPRNALGAEKAGAHLAGGQAEGWTAFALDASSPAPVAWTQDSLYAYLRQGWHPDHGVTNGPMGEVTGNLGLLPDSDVHAIATYLASLMGTPSPERVQKGEEIRKQVSDSLALVSAPSPAADTPTGRGQAIYEAACATCHDGSRPLPFGGINFHLSTTINAPDAQNAINTVLFGLPAASGRQSAIMPGFAATMNDQQLADLLAYLRDNFAGKPAWADVASRAADTRNGKFQVSVRPSDGIERGPDNIGAQDQ
ncbi:c-type cytochrome [Rhizobium sp. P32RR-XVIII]|nr:c-type cytochrome [Rhizobium sp. P32RR-XVIII]